MFLPRGPSFSFRHRATFASLNPAPDNIDIRPFRATFRDPAVERAYLAFRRADQVRSCMLALMAGGVCYAAAGVSDPAVFGESGAKYLATVEAVRAAGVLLCFGMAAVVWRLKSSAAVNVGSVVAMLGTLMTYSVITYLEQSSGGNSDFRLVFSVFSLLAFIFFPIPVEYSAGAALGMMINVTLLFAMLGDEAPGAVARTLALMLTFAVGGAAFSIRTNSSRRMEHALRGRLEQSVRELEREAEQRRGAERELREHKENLEEMVRAKTEELRQSERQLVASQRTEAIGKLAGGLAHDFNNLLVAIIGNAQLTLELDGLPPRAKEYQRDALGAAERASSLARDVLTFSRRQLMEFHPLSLTELLAQFASILRTAAGADVTIRIDASDSTPPIIGARGPLEQMVLNLVLNARDATGPGGQIDIETGGAMVDAATAARYPDVEPGQFGLLTVSDNGGGIDAANLERIFEPFFTTKTEGRGSGLGLSVVHGIVRQHRGFVKVSANVGGGARFEIFLPATSEPIPSIAGRAVASSEGGQECVLVVDDEEIVLRLVERILTGAGYRVLTAASSETAIELFRRHADTIDVVVSDLVMPGLSGEELMKRIRQLAPMVPFMFASGYSDGGIHKSFVLNEGITLLSKPYLPADLKRKVREVLDAGRV